MFPGARWVKAFNSVYFKTLESEAHRSGDRLGIPLAGDDRDALEVASRLVRDAGFDPVIVGDLARGREFEPNTPPYNTGMSGEKLRQYFRITSAGGGERGFVPGDGEQGGRDCQWSGIRAESRRAECESRGATGLEWDSCPGR